MPNRGFLQNAAMKIYDNLAILDVEDEMRSTFDIIQYEILP